METTLSECLSLKKSHVSMHCLLFVYFCGGLKTLSLHAIQRRSLVKPFVTFDENIVSINFVLIIGNVSGKDLLGAK